jgi:hypothetical protein
VTETKINQRGEGKGERGKVKNRDSSDRTPDKRLYSFLGKEEKKKKNEKAKEKKRKRKKQDEERTPDQINGEFLMR